MTCASQTSWKFAAFVATMLAASAGGCGSGDIGQVHGLITVNGQPVGPGSVFFDPIIEEDTGQRPAIAQFGSDGKYVLVMAGNVPGARVGKYRVTVRPNSGDFGAEEAQVTGKASPIHPRYLNPDSSGLTADVVAGDQKIDFDLDP